MRKDKGILVIYYGRNRKACKRGKNTGEISDK